MSSNDSLVYYKIQNKVNPTMFRTSDGRWHKNGKIYDTLGKLRSVITQHMENYYESERIKVNDWNIVEYEVTVKAVKEVADVIDPKKLIKMLSVK
jgi:hypothetical protein